MEKDEKMKKKMDEKDENAKKKNKENNSNDNDEKVCFHFNIFNFWFVFFMMYYAWLFLYLILYMWIKKKPHQSFACCSNSSLFFFSTKCHIDHKSMNRIWHHLTTSR